MLEWIAENKDWIFSGIGVTVVASVFGIIKSKAGFKLTYHFFATLFVAVILSLGFDYFFNYDGDFRLRLFIFGLTVICTFMVESRIHILKQKIEIRKAVNELSLDDCEYVVQCHRGTETFKFDFESVSSLPSKFDNIRYVPTGEKIIINKPYEICVYKYAYKLVKRRMKKSV